MAFRDSDLGKYVHFEIENDWMKLDASNFNIVLVKEPYGRIFKVYVHFKSLCDAFDLPYQEKAKFKCLNLCTEELLTWAQKNTNMRLSTNHLPIFFFSSNNF